MYVYIYINIHIHIYVCMYEYTSVHIFMYSCMCIMYIHTLCIPIHIHTYTLISYIYIMYIHTLYISIHIRTYIHIYITFMDICIPSHRNCMKHCFYYKCVFDYDNTLQHTATHCNTLQRTSDLGAVRQMAQPLFQVRVLLARDWHFQVS